MTSTTTTTYYHPSSSSSGGSSSSNSMTRNHYSSTSKYSDYNSSRMPPSSSGRYLGSTTSSYSTMSNYKSRSSYDLNSSSSSSSSYRPSSYLSSISNYSSSTYNPSNEKSFLSKSSTYSTSHSPSLYLNKYSLSSSPSTGATTTGYGTGTTSTTKGVVLTRFNNRRSSFDDFGTDSIGTISKGKNPVPGLSNLGNTCYMNSVLQSLYCTKSLRDYILNGYESGQLYSALSKLFKEMSSSRSSYVDPTMFRAKFIQIEPKFRGTDQHDAQEFLSYLINDLHEEQNKAKLKQRGNKVFEPKSAIEAWNIYRDRFNDSKFVELFVGQFSSVIKCTYCGNESTCWDPFWDISLPVPRHRSRVDIEECLAEFTAAETLDGNEQPFCSKCKQHRKSTKRLSIVLSPKILVIHLKKFSNDGYKLSSDIVVNQQIKIDNSNGVSTIIQNDYQQQQQQQQYHHGRSTSTSSTTYELYACVCHHGYSSRSGHYTAYCQYDSKWFHCNDEKVSEVTDSFSMSTLKDAYVLFYRIAENSNSNLTAITAATTLKYSSRL